MGQLAKSRTAYMIPLFREQKTDNGIHRVNLRKRSLITLFKQRPAPNVQTSGLGGAYRCPEQDKATFSLLGTDLTTAVQGFLPGSTEGQVSVQQAVETYTTGI